MASGSLQEPPQEAVGKPDAPAVPETAPDPVALLGVLADPDRLGVFAALVLGARSTAEIADRAGAHVRDAVRTLSILEEAGLAARVGDGWHACPERLREAAPTADGESADEYPGHSSAEIAVLRTYLTGGRLVRGLPPQRAKRLVVLDHIAGGFEPGVRYSEAQIGEVLRRVTDDPGTLRRQLVDEGFLGGERGLYWRTGGTFDV